MFISTIRSLTIRGARLSHTEATAAIPQPRGTIDTTLNVYCFFSNSWRIYDYLYIYLFPYFLWI